MEKIAGIFKMSRRIVFFLRLHTATAAETLERTGKEKKHNWAGRLLMYCPLSSLVVKIISRDVTRDAIAQSETVKSSIVDE